MYSPHLDKVVQIAGALAVPAKELFDWSSARPPAPERRCRQRPARDR
ncbi:hypothetical protein [Nonomuraea rubra]